MAKQTRRRIRGQRAAEADPYDARRDELRRLPPLERIAAIERELKDVTPIVTDSATFHRKKLLRMHDAARLEAGLVAPAELQRENDPFANRDFRQARIVWQPRPSCRDETRA